MLLTYTKEFMINNRGCYTPDKVIDLYFKKEKITEITYKDILKSDIRIKDKYWFFCKKVFTKEQNQQIAIGVAEIVLPIYEKKYPENKAPREAIEAAKLYITGHITLEALLLKRKAAAYAAYATADAAAYAADATAYAADATAYAAAYAAYAAADAADAAKNFVSRISYNRKLEKFLADFIKNNKDK